MKRTTFPALALILASCWSSGGRPERPPGALFAAADPNAVIIPQDEDDEGPPKPDDPAARARRLKERFPGVKKLELVKLLAWTEPRTGVCWSELTPLPKAAISIRYSEGKSRSPKKAADLSGLVERGWTAVYRAPQGEGFERRARFHDVDLTFETSLACRCAPGPKVIEGEKRRLRLRFRWSEGKSPEVSATALRGERREGLIGNVTVGRLASYDFPLPAPFPDGRTGTCGAHLSLAILIDPPVL